MKTQKLRQLFLLSAIAGLVASQSVMAFQSQGLDPAPDPDLLALTKEDEAMVQNLFDEFDLTVEERSGLLALIDPTIPGVIEDVVSLGATETMIPMEEHPEYVELMERISTMVGYPVSDCGTLSGGFNEGVTLAGGYYYYLTGDITCTLQHHDDAGISVGSLAVLDLRGYSVTSTNHKGRGVQLSQSAVLFGGVREPRGLVSGFEVGVYSEANSNLILHVESSNNVEHSGHIGTTGHGIFIHGIFKHHATHLFNGHRVIYSHANNNDAVGVFLNVTDQSNATGDVSIYGNRVYGSVANNNGEEGIATDIETYHGTYDSVNVFRNSVSHSRADNNELTGIALEVLGYTDAVNPIHSIPIHVSDAFSSYENTISHSSVNCDPNLSCFTKGVYGILFSVDRVTNTGDSPVSVVNNSLSANSAENYGSGTGILLNVSNVTASGNGNVSVSTNQITSNRALHNAEGLDILIGYLAVNGSGDLDIADNLVAFNRGDYSVGNSSVTPKLPGHGINVQILNFGVNTGAIHLDDNLFFANVAHHNANVGLIIDPSAPVAASLSTSLATVTSTASHNKMLFNQLSHNSEAGLYVDVTMVATGSTGRAEAKYNRVGFNRVIGSEVGILSGVVAAASATSSHSAEVTHNQMDHNVVLDSEAIGIIFELVSENGNGSHPVYDIAYQNRVRRNFVDVETQATGVCAYMTSIGYSDDSKRNGIFRNLIVGGGYGIVTGVPFTPSNLASISCVDPVVLRGLDNLIRRNFVAGSAKDGITVTDTNDIISDNISILSGDFNFVDVPGQTDSTACNDWDNNTYYGFEANKVNPPICVEVKS